MSELNFIIDKLADIRKDIGVSNFSGFLEQTQLQIEQLSNEQRCFIDLYYHSTAIPTIRKTAEEIKTSASARLHLSFITDKRQPVRVFPEVMPAIAVILLDEDLCNDNKPLNYFQQRSQQYKLVFLVDFSEGESLTAAFSRKLDRSIKLFQIPADSIRQQPIEEILSEKVDKTKMEQLNSWAKFNALKPLLPLLQDIFLSENKILQTRKLLNGQHSQIIRKEEQQINVSDFTGNLKQLVQKNMQDMEKNYRSKYEELNKPNTGKFSKVATEVANQVKDFHRSDIAEKSEKVSISIDEATSRNFIREVSQTLQEEFKKDEAYINSIYDDLITKVNGLLTEKNMAPLKPTELSLPFPDKEKILRSYGYINKPYTGELVKKGFNEYFVALRDYTGLIMVVAGLLAPLNMVASASDDSFMKAWSPALKQMTTYIRVITAMITLAMIVYGIYDLRKRIPRKRNEEFARELGKAKETLNQEGKRIFNESSRDWQAAVSNWIRDVGQNILNAIEVNVKQVSQHKMNQMNLERMQQQRSQQSLDTILRNIGYAEKHKDTLVTRFKDVHSNIEKELKF